MTKRTFEEFERIWFCLDANTQMLIPIGDHGDYEAALATAWDLDYDVVWLISGTEADTWVATINSQRF